VSQLGSICEQLLTNPLIEDYEIQLSEAAAT
jgi:phosphoribosylformylglycinamidine (FGAM) synthase PurS component